jgi:hypothetical protein
MERKMRKRAFKIYYEYESNRVLETQFCCKTMKDYWKLLMVFFNPEDLTVITKEGIVFKYCPDCGGKVVIKESRL